MSGKIIINKSGETLIETVVSVAVFFIIAVFFCSIFVFASDMSGINSKLKHSGNQVAGGLELYKGGATTSSNPGYTINTTGGNFVVSYPNQTITAAGNYVAGNNSDIKYKDFKPGP